MCGARAFTKDGEDSDEYTCIPCRFREKPVTHNHFWASLARAILVPRARMMAQRDVCHANLIILQASLVPSPRTDRAESCAVCEGVAEMAAPSTPCMACCGAGTVMEPTDDGGLYERACPDCCAMTHRRAGE